MVAHVEEAHALLDQFEVGDENKTVCRYPLASSSVYGRQSLHWVKRPWSARLRASLVTIVLLCALGAMITLYGAQTSPSVSVDTNHLGYLLNPHKHISRPPTTLVFNWTVTSGLRSPDGVQKEVYLVNGQFPGPIIEARSGDRIVVHVTNGLGDEGLSLHWHGLRLKKQNSMDGAVGFTQTAIQSSDTFIYDFTVGDDERGTFWWHSHSDLQRADGLWGGLVIHSPDDSSSKGDYLIMVSDWFHRNQSEVLSWYADANSRGNEPVPDSLLVNGQGRFNCSMAVPARPITCSQVTLHGLKPLLKSANGKSMRLRVVNTGSVAGFTVRMTGATIRPIRIDGGFDVQAETAQTTGILYPGQRVDLDVKWDPNHSTAHQMVIYMDEEDFGYPNPSLNPIQTFPIFSKDVGVSNTELSELTMNDVESRVLNFQSMKAATKVTDLLPKAEKTIVLYSKVEKLAHMDYEPVGFINHTSWKPQSPPLISQNRSSWDENQLIPFIGIRREQPTRVDIIINNLDDGAHPFHIHGHSFYVLSSYKNPGRDSWGSYNPYTGEPLPNGLDLDYPVRVDTVTVPRRGHVVLALVADNPGIWALHCHMLVHMARGMAMGLEIGYIGGETNGHQDDRTIQG